MRSVSLGPCCPLYPIFQLPHLPHSLISTHHWADHHQTTHCLHRHAHIGEPPTPALPTTIARAISLEAPGNHLRTQRWPAVGDILTEVPQLLQHGNCTPGVRYTLPYGATRTPREIWLLVPPFPNTTVRPWFRHLHLWFRTILLICSLLLLLLVHSEVCYDWR